MTRKERDFVKANLRVARVALADARRYHEDAVNRGDNEYAAQWTEKAGERLHHVLVLQDLLNGNVG